MPEFTDLKALRVAVGTTFGPSSELPVTRDMIDRFADLTHDHQWIHAEVESARHSALGTTTAHGCLTLALAAPFLEELVRVGNAETTPASVEDRPGGADAVFAPVMRTPTSPEPVCAAEVVVRFAAAREGAQREEPES
jgi:hypothetical protein